MALGDTNINTTNVGAEVGSSIKNVSGLVGLTGLNKYSYYAPGSLGVDSNKNIVLTPPVLNYKLGDYRLYNHTANPPAIWSPPSWLGWYNSTVDFVLPYSLSTMNLYAFATRGDYIQFNFYNSFDYRENQQSVMWGGDTRRFTIPVVADSPLIGHTRQSTAKVNTSGWILCSFTGCPTSWLSSSQNTDVFVEAYISDMAGNRVINLGTSRTAGYKTIGFHRMVSPYLCGWNNNVPSPPSGYTAIWSAVSANGGAVCGYGDNINQTLNTTTYDFYVCAKAVYGSGSTMYRVVEFLYTDIILTVKGVRTVCATHVPLSYTNGLHCQGSLLSGSWNLDSIGYVTFENVTIDAVPNYTQC